MELELESLAKRFGSWKWIAKGNEMADKLAAKGVPITPQPVKFLEGLEAFVLCEGKKESELSPLTVPFRAHLRYKPK
jgi:hypothetical protein